MIFNANFKNKKWIKWDLWIQQLQKQNITCVYEIKYLELVFEPAFGLWPPATYEFQYVKLLSRLWTFHLPNEVNISIVRAGTPLKRVIWRSPLGLGWSPPLHRLDMYLDANNGFSYPTCKKDISLDFIMKLTFWDRFGVLHATFGD